MYANYLEQRNGVGEIGEDWIREWCLMNAVNEKLILNIGTNEVELDLLWYM